MEKKEICIQFDLKFYWNWFQRRSFLKKNTHFFEDLLNMYCTKILMGKRFLRIFWSLLIVWPENWIIRVLIWYSSCITLDIISHTIVNVRISAAHLDRNFSEDFDDNKNFRWPKHKLKIRHAQQLFEKISSCSNYNQFFKQLMNFVGKEND